MSETLVVTEVVNAVVVTPIENTVEVASVGVQGPAGATGATGATGSSGVVTVNAPITNAGTSTAANLSVSTGSTSAAGVLQLTDSVSSTSTTTAATPNSVKTAYNSSLIKGVILPYRSGFYYRTPHQALTTATATHETTYYTPIFITSSTTFDRIAIRAVSGFSGTATVRLGIYADSAGIPDVLVLDAGTVSATTANATFQITINQTLSTGFYWLAMCQQSTAPTAGVYSGNSATASTGNPLIFSGGTGAPTSNLIAGYTQSSVTGAFANAGTLTAATIVTYTWIRAL